MNIDKLRARLETVEGRKRLPYEDTDHNLTIGVGHNLSADGLTDSQITQIRDDDIAECIDGLDHALPWFAQLDEVRQRALTELCFNLGISRLLDFKKMLAAMEVESWGGAAAELMDSEAARELPARYRVLAGMMTTGKDPAL